MKKDCPYYEMTINDWLELLEDANEVLRSTYSIAMREGKQVGWKYFQKRVQKTLKRQHKIMYPERSHKECCGRNMGKNYLRPVFKSTKTN